MKKAWRAICIVVLIAILLGAVAIGVGVMTGADMNRIYSVLDNRYHFEVYIEYFNQVLGALQESGLI